MAAGETTQGRRREDVPFGDLPSEIEPGDYWKYLDRETGEPMKANRAGNLTDTVWGFYAPNGCGIGTLRLHTVRENEDSTATIAPGDGSSNSVMITRGTGGGWHGYMDHGIWREV